jgi:hypothetical protein
VEDGYYGEDSFSYRVTDEHGLSATRDMIISVVDGIEGTALPVQLIKSGGVDAWDGGAYSSQSLTGAVSFSFVPTDIASSRTVGLSTLPGSSSYNSVEFGLLAYQDGALYVYEKGVERGQFGTYEAGDVLAVSRDSSGVVTYTKNGDVFFTSSVISSPDTALMADVSFFEIGASIDAAVFTDSTGKVIPVNWITDANMEARPLNEGNAIEYVDVNGDGVLDARVGNGLYELLGSGVNLEGTAGHDVIGGSDLSDTLIGQGGNDRLEGFAGDDVLEGGDGQDHLSSGDGNDLLDGGHGNDTLWGGSGNDTLIGGNGSDTFVFESGFEHDLIKDAEAHDILSLGSGLDQDDVWLFREDDNLVVQLLGTEDRLTVADWFDGTGNHQLDHIGLSNGNHLAAGGVQALVDAMSVFGVNNVSADTIDHTSSDFNNVQVIIAANWKSV